MSGAMRGHLAMLLFSDLIAGSFALGSMAAGHIAPAALTAARFLIATVIVGAAALVSTGITRRDFEAPWRYILMGGLLGFIL